MRRSWMRPHPSRVDPAAPSAARITAAHDAAVAAGEASYADPATGASVFTAPALAGQGACCGQGCRHCPWVGAEEEGVGGPG